MTTEQMQCLRELVDDLDRVVLNVSSCDGDTTARQYARADSIRALLAELDAARAREVELTDAIDSLLSLITGETGENCDVQRAIEALSETRAQFEARILKRDAKLREALNWLKAQVADYRAGSTKPRSRRAADRGEIVGIQGTLAVIAADIDKAIARAALAEGDPHA